MPISVGGIASGLDVDGIISQLLELEQRPLVVLQRKIALQEAKKASYTDLEGRLGNLRTAANDFDNNLFGNITGTSSDEGIVSVSVTDSTSVGSQQLKVMQLAVNHRMAGAGFVDDSGTGVAAAGPNQTFSFKVGSGAVVDIAVDDTVSLRQLADAINDAGADVQADIVNDGSSTNPFRLVLTSNKAGNDGLITVTNNDTSIDFANTVIEASTADAGNAADYTGTVTSSGSYTGAANTQFIVDIITAGAADGTAKYRFSTDGGLTYNDNAGAGFDVTSGGPLALADGVEINFTDDGTALQVGDTFRVDVFNPELQAPQEAVIELNGITIIKPTNTLTDVVKGMTIDLKSAAPGTTVTVGVTKETGDVTAALTKFVASYNSAIGFLQSQFSYDPASGGAAPPLNGDSAARQVQRTLKNLLTSRISGLGSDTLSGLSEIGIQSNETNGLISLDTGKLQKALDADPTAVERLLTGFGEKLNGTGFKYIRRTADSQPGTYDVRITSSRSRAKFTAGAAAQVLGANETLTFTLTDTNVDTVLTVDLLQNDTVATQIQKMNDAFTAGSLGVSAFLDANGKINLRTTEYGAQYKLDVQSSVVAGSGTNIGQGNAQVLGSDLEGTIGGSRARVLDGNRLKGDDGFSSEGVEIEIDDEIVADGSVLGRIRIIDGFSEIMPEALNALTGTNGVIGSRMSGANTKIEGFEDQILKISRRVATVEKRLRKQFTRLEVTLGRYQALGDYVTQQLDAMSSQRK